MRLVALDSSLSSRAAVIFPVDTHLLPSKVRRQVLVVPTLVGGFSSLFDRGGRALLVRLVALDSSLSSRAAVIFPVDTHLLPSKVRRLGTLAWSQPSVRFGSFVEIQ